MARSHELGRAGELAAAKLLREAGWTILERNVRFGRKEIDLVVRRDGVVAFVEVKTRAGRACGHPLESITARKRREIERVARWWVARYGSAGEQYRFDAIAVDWGGDGAPRLEHVVDAWRLG
ncbi:MAG: YraN family protein [Longimicrobiales bacterium]